MSRMQTDLLMTIRNCNIGWYRKQWKIIVGTVRNGWISQSFDWVMANMNRKPGGENWGHAELFILTGMYWRRWIVRATKGAKVTATASMSVVTSPGDGLWPYLLYNTVSVSYIFQLSHSIVSSLVAEDDVTKRWIVTSGGMIAASHPSLLYKVPIEPELDWLDPGLLTRMFARQSSSWSSALP